MKNIALNILLILSVIGGSILINSCDDGYRINTKKLIREEQELMADYLDIVEDTLTQFSDTTINKLDDLGYIFFETKAGTGDSVKVGKNVGFRYIYYEIVRDSIDTPFIYPYQSNYNSANPFTYTVGTTNIYQGIYSGIDLPIRHMTYGSKARVFVFSSLWNSDYAPRVIDLEVTYVEK